MVKSLRRKPRVVAEKWLKRLVTKTIGQCEGATQSILADSCPVPEG